MQDGVAVGLLLSLLVFGNLLQRCGDIEVNPGPPKSDNLRQTRLMSGGADRRNSVERGGPAASGRGEAEPTLRDVMSMLSSMNVKFDEMKEDLKEMRESFSNLKNEVGELREEVSDLRRVNDELKTENVDLKARVENVERKTDDLECRSRRNNLIIYGLPRQDDESWQDCEDSVREMIVDKLELVDDFQFDRVHRLNGKPDSPVVARCTFYKDKDKILKAKRKLQGSHVFIGEDFSQRIREIRKKLSPHLKTAKSEGKRATMIFDHLLINGKKFFLDKDENIQEIA